jgi:7-cyano-7-deazaguanine reductase
MEWAPPKPGETVLTETNLPGEIEISRAELEAVSNPTTHRDYTVDLTYPEFTCKCPRTGYPDFAIINLTYVPADSICELKSFKLYLNRYRDRYAFHEAVTNQILDDFVRAIAPKEAEIVADWNPRGNLKTIVRASYSATP